MSNDRGFDRAALEPKWQRALDWVEKEVGGRVVRAERQDRWRPAFFLDVERDGEIVSVYFRGDRGETGSGVYSLEHEIAVFEVLASEGLPVPHVWGLCPEPRGIVMESVPGRPDLSTADSEEDRRLLLEQMVDLYADLHSIDPKRFEDIGVERPRAEELPLGDFPRWEATYRKRKSAPEPLIEFGIGWIRRHLPERNEISCLHGDAGQFLFEGSRITALIDFELACLGDPLSDIGTFRARDLSEPMGDMGPALGRYALRTGRSLDPAVLDFYTIRFCLQTPIAVSEIVRRCPPGTNLAQYFAWYLVYGRVPVELIARQEGIEVEAPSLPESPRSPRTVAFDFLVDSLGGDGRAESYELDVPLRVAQYLRRAERYGRALDEEDLDEVAALIGRRPRTRLEADAALEEFISTAPPELDGPLARYFVRRCLREESLLAPAMRELAGARVQLV